MMSDVPPPEPRPSFETALIQLQEIVADLEEGNTGLEESLARFEQGIGLLRSCYQILERAEHKIELLVNADAAGEVATTPFDGTATAESGKKTPAKTGRRRTAAPAATPSEPPEDAADNGKSLF